MCSTAVTLGGGMTITNGSRSPPLRLLRFSSAEKIPARPTLVDGALVWPGRTAPAAREVPVLCSSPAQVSGAIFSVKSAASAIRAEAMLLERSLPPNVRWSVSDPHVISLRTPLGATAEPSLRPPRAVSWPWCARAVVSGMSSLLHELAVFLERAIFQNVGGSA